MSEDGPCLNATMTPASVRKRVFFFFFSIACHVRSRAVADYAGCHHLRAGLGGVRDGKREGEEEDEEEEGGG